MNDVKLICFDLDDTLWPVSTTIKQAEAVFFEHLQKLAPKLTAQYSQDAIRAHRLDYLKHYPELRHNISAWRRESLTALLKSSGHGLHSESIAEEVFIHFLEARQLVTPFDHCETTLEALSKNYQLIGLTNGNADLARIAVGQHFTAYFRAEEFGANKPEPALFKKALEVANCSPHQAVHIGDHIEDDIGGAKALGFYTLQARLTAKAPLPSDDADGHFDDWRQLPELIKGLGKPALKNILI